MISVLILNVQVCSPETDARYLLSSQGTLQDNKYVIIKLPVCLTSRMNGGPVVGQCYCVRYACDTGMRCSHFCYLGVIDQQLIFINNRAADEGRIPQRKDFNFRPI